MHKLNQFIKERSNNCDASFSRKGHLNGHVKSVHEEKKNFRCKIRDVVFSKKGHLNRHIESVHDGKKPIQM